MFEHNKFDRDFRIMEIIFKIMFPIIFFGALVLMGIQLYLGIKTVQAIDEHGLKAVVERVWEGPNGTLR